MITLLSDLKFIFNGISSDEMGLYRVYIDREQATHPFCGAKTITTARAMYAQRDIITKVSSEPLTFSLTFTAMDKPFTPLKIREIYSYFDVDNFAKLSFQSNPDFYYNVMPMTSQQEINLYNQDTGYFSLDFVCDSHHGWIDREYHFSTSDSGLWSIYNESNVRNEYGNYLVYPTISVNMKKGTHFGICPQYKTIADNTDGQLDLSETETYNWFRLVNLKYTYDESTDTGLQFTIDNANRQIYNDTNDTNLLSYIYKKNNTPQYNFVGLQEGHTYLYREKLVSDEELDFDLTLNVSYPVIM